MVKKTPKKPQKKPNSQLSSILDVFKTQKKAFNQNVNELEKPFWRYKARDFAIICGAIMFFGSLGTKYLNFFHWWNTGFDMSSYNPMSIALYIPMSIAWFWYGFYRNDMVLKVTGFLGLISTAVLSYGIIKTYYLPWLP